MPQEPYLELTGYVTLGKLFPCSVAQFPHQYKRIRIVSISAGFSED